MFHLLSNQIFRNLFVKGKQPSFRGETSGGVFKRSAVQYLMLQFLPRDYKHPRQFHMGVALGDRPQV